jgi:peptide/nickel transport system substrate-binding protein
MKRLTLFLSLILVTSMLLSGCAKTPTPEPIATEVPVVTEAVAPAAFVDENRVLHLAVNAAIETMDAHATNNLNANWIIKQMYEGLIYYNYEDALIEPRIASSYEMSTDGLTWTFKLRDDVKFHSGDTLTASDVVFSYIRAIATPAMANYTTSIESVTAPDSSTVVIKLKNTVAPFLQYVSSIAIMNEKFVTGLAGSISTVENGTGPYKADSIDLALGVTALAFTDYYRGVANIRSIKWDVITDSSASSMALQAGDLDYLQIAYSQYSSLEADPNFTVGVVPQRHTIYVAFNSSKPPFDNVLVRQAISYIIDREAVAQVTFEGLADVDSLLMSPKLDGMPPYEELTPYMYGYDPQKGLALLREAGYDTTKPIDLGSIRTYPESHYASKPTLIIQADLAAYGIKLEIETMEVSAFVQALYGGDYTMACAAGAYGADASGYAPIFGSSTIGVTGGNPFYWSDPEVDALFAQGVAETDPKARQTIYGNIMKILYEQAPGTGMAHKYTVVAWSKSLAPVLRMDYPMIYEWNFVAE